jgi:hypothetical protein
MKRLLPLGIGAAVGSAIGLGAVYGLWTASFVVLSKAEGAGQHAAYILPSALATGAVIGAAIRWLDLS